MTDETRNAEQRGREQGYRAGLRAAHPIDCECGGECLRIPSEYRAASPTPTPDPAA